MNVKLLKGNLLEVIENKKFDIVVCNILADVLIKLLDEIKIYLERGLDSSFLRNNRGQVSRSYL